MDPLVRLILIAVISYLIGSIPTAVIVSRRFFGFDIREKGSGNMGSTNAFRILGVKWGIFVQVVDILKGIAAVFVVAQLFQGGEMPFVNHTPFEDLTLLKIIAGVCAVVGHIWSVFVNFRGGKGINTAVGMLIGVAPVEVGVIALIFLLTVLASGYISLGSILAAVALPTTMALRYNLWHVEIQGYHTLIFFFIGLSLLVLYTHRTNIKRLLAGNENRFQKLWLFRGKQR
jgi:glycerol-3-phosphate acyltransferase PlsY